MATAKTKGQLYQINGQYYYIEVSFYNGVYKDPVNIPMGIIEEINIKESLYDWSTTGYITFQNDFQLLERGLQSKKQDTGEKQTVNFLCDRPDGRNKFCIRIYPTDVDNKDQKDFLESNKEDFELCHDFVVYDIQDLPTSTAEKKLKRYYFWDERYQLLLERNLEWSTALATKKLYNIENFTTDDQRKLPANIAVREFLKEASKYPDGTDIKVGFEEGGDMSKPEYIMGEIDDKKWNMGKNENKIFYTSFSRSNGMDDLNYLLKFCCDENGFPVILDLGRTTKNKKFSLVSLKTIFDNSAKNQKEIISLVDTKDGEMSKAWDSRGPMKLTDNPLQNFSSGHASKITSYQFSPMVNFDDLQQTTSPLHTFDFDRGEFQVLFEGNTIDDFIKKATEMCSGLFNLQKDKKGQLLIKNNKVKQDSGIIKNYHTALTNVPSNLPCIQMLKDFIFLNQTLVFQTYGLTLRTPGNFITLESIHSTSETNDFWDKFLGQWLITEVQHNFTQKSYTNVVSVNKVDSHNKVYPINDSKYIA
jgi:hypothetical protein